MKYYLLTIACICFGATTHGQFIIDHKCTDITKVPSSWMIRAKQDLHIAYGHTSHGSQITTGMAGLVGFANGGGKGLALGTDFFAYNNGGSDGALDLHDSAMAHDVGYYPEWVNNTTNYLDDPANADVNVIMWSWCGQVDEKYVAGTLTNEYLAPMTALEEKYPDVTFVYMTGHVDMNDDADNKAANSAIRRYCRERGKVLYDFANIEHYDPDNRYFEFVHDDCAYYSSYTDMGSYAVVQGNWATEWQQFSTKDMDWYDCPSAHSEPLNANQKAYAAWWMFARIAGWEGNGAYSDWCNTEFSEEELRTESEGSFWGKTADPDQDGMINLFEQALGTDPFEENSGSSFIFNSSDCMSNRVVFSYQRSCSFEGCSFIVESVDQLGGEWVPVVSNEYELSVSDASNEMVQVRMQMNTSETHRFYRIVLKKDD